MRRVIFRHHPCLTCGACCAAFRVSFYWREAGDTPEGTVPVTLTEDITGLRRCMRGTNQSAPRCVALAGTIGLHTHCTIYALRPSPCREFGLQRVPGGWSAEPEQLARCNQARARHGLAPLRTPRAPRRRMFPHIPPRRTRPRSA